jgi:hypothetical protein|nr:MAG TPA: hypothetical protein [Caudoviricetes sp.]
MREENQKLKEMAKKKGTDYIQVDDFSSASLDEVDLIRGRMNAVDPIKKDSITPIVFTADSPSQYQYGKVTAETLDSIKDLYVSYNQKYGLNINLEVETIMSNFKSIIDPKELQVFEVYLSEAYSRFRLVIYQRLMITIAGLVDEISKPLGNDVPIQDRYVMIDKLLDYMTKINQVYEEIKIEHSDVELQRLSGEISRGDDKLRLTGKDEATMGVLRKLNETILNENKN